MYDIGIIGHGFVGLACETGFQEIANVHIYDRFKHSDSLEDVVALCDIIFLCVPTPMHGDYSCDTSILKDVVSKIDQLTNDRKILVIKSTVPPGTTEELSRKYEKHAFFFNPEFLTEANFINDFLEQDRIILGKTMYTTSTDRNKLYEFYLSFTKKQETPAAVIVKTSSHVAEMVKYTTNCFLATKVAFFNEIYDICEKANISYKHVIDALLFDYRIGKTHYMVPGPDGKRGFGLSCFPKDLNALATFANNLGVDPIILNSVWSKNLMVREEYDWEDLPQVNGNYEKED